jgi:hypothetical protein
MMEIKIGFAAANAVFEAIESYIPLLGFGRLGVQSRFLAGLSTWFGNDMMGTWDKRHAQDYFHEKRPVHPEFVSPRSQQWPIASPIIHSPLRHLTLRPKLNRVIMVEAVTVRSARGAMPRIKSARP